VRRWEKLTPEDRRAVRRLLIVAAVAAAGYLTLLLTGQFSVSHARELGDRGGVLAPMVFVLISASLTLVSFPAALLAGASGLLFGTAEGFVLSLTAATLGGTMAHQVGRHAAGQLFVNPREGRVGTIVSRLKERSFMSVLYARILPGLPFTMVSYAAGIAAVPLRAFVPATVLGAAPRAYAYTALGGHLGNLRDPQALVAFGILIALALGSLVIARIQRRRGRAP